MSRVKIIKKGKRTKQNVLNNLVYDVLWYNNTLSSPFYHINWFIRILTA